jgi:hypothetical protein
LRKLKHRRRPLFLAIPRETKVGEEKIEGRIDEAAHQEFMRQGRGKNERQRLTALRTVLVSPLCSVGSVSRRSVESADVDCRAPSRRA